MKKLLPIFILFQLLLTTHLQAQEKRVVVGRDIGSMKNLNISGRIIDEITGDALVGATVTVRELNKTEVTSTNGTFSFVLDRAEYILEFRYIGYETVTYPIVAVGDGRINLTMIQEDFTLDDVVIFGRDPEKNIRSTEMGAISISMNTLKELPPFLGEVDIIRSVATLPGVSQVGEASSGLNVRGGGADQNLITFAGAPVYNPSHLFGLFTAFNPDVVNDFTLYKAQIPTKFGGRGSSILDITPKSGSLTKWGGDMMVGTVSGKASINGPIVKDVVSAQLSFRGSYINWLLNSLNNPELRTSQANFNDINGILYGEINENHNLTYSFYRSYDDFALASDTTISWTNQSQSLRYLGQFGEKLSVDLIGFHTLYDFSIFNQSGINNFDLNSGIIDTGGRLSLTYQLGENNRINFGGDTKRLTIQPGELIPSENGESGVLPQKVQNEYAMESGFFFQHEFELGEKLGFSYGVRYDTYTYYGPRTVRQYAENLPLNASNVIGERTYSDGEAIQTYDGWGPRASIRYSIDKNTSIKAGYNKMYQFIHLISNTATIAPTDVWKLSDQFLRPQIVDQYSLGIYKNFKGNIFESSVEVYYKDIQNVVEYKDGARLLLQNHLETEIIPGEGQAYGVEVYVKKNLGRATGWASYTYSRALRRVITPFEEEIINDGNWFPANFDKPHDLTLIGNYKISSFTSLSATFSYSTGRPVTFPEAKFDFAGNSLAFFRNRNLQRIPDFHRLDLSLNFKFQGDGKFYDGDWTFAVMNAYGRKNPFSIFFADQPGSPPQAFRLAILGVPLPTLSYSLKF
ncbi:TonB-dependent receptor [Mongoliibacter ruber]|uniref:TonB-dependent receptor-like protein n=1 Tax=Mongoliibacter ruber TaxID=1750599 RepID=A0A2T0WIW6_9BACT|nr:TonB-dependent receptor [Mongoliibacter ruber]PRY86605.1 TonB-dependent receptor-like protein [Mongoliibacter ruber]